MHSNEEQQVLAAVERAGEAVALAAKYELEREYGPDWLDRVNERRKAEGYVPGRGMHDHRFVLSLVAHDPALVQAFDVDDRTAARRLNGMGNAVVHNESLRDGDAARALDLAQRLTRRTEPVGHTTSAGAPQRPSAPVSREVPDTGAAADQPLTPDQMLQQVQRMYSDERYEAALGAAESCIRLARDDADAWSAKTACLHQLERYREGVGAARKWSSLEPENAWAWVWKARSLERLGRVKEARTACERAIALQPDDLQLRSEIRDLHLGLSRVLSARRRELR
jgi:tetratricopeptide (TPR) repeat protein